MAGVTGGLPDQTRGRTGLAAMTRRLTRLAVHPYLVLQIFVQVVVSGRNGS